MQNPFLDADQNIFLPIEKITQLQMEAGERIIKSQANLLGELYSKSLVFSDTLFAKSTFDGVWQAQQEFLSDCGASFFNTAEENVGVISDANDKIMSIVQDSLSDIPSMTDARAVAESIITGDMDASGATKRPAPQPVTQASKQTKEVPGPAAKKPAPAAKKATSKTANQAKSEPADS